MEQNQRRNINPDSVREPEAANRNVEGEGKKGSFDEKNYLNIKLADNQSEKSLRIRLLPIDGESGELFKEIESHSIKLSPKLQKAMKLPSPFKSYHCLKKTVGLKEEFGHRCPFCERNWEMYQMTLKEGISEEEKKHWQDESFACKSHPAVILRCIERGKEEDGPKFLKVNLRSDKMDIFHLLLKISDDRKAESVEEAKDANGGELPQGFKEYNVFDLYNGKDIKMTISRVYDKNGNDLGRTSATVTDYGNSKPLAAKDGQPDYAQIDEWLDNPKKWYDVFTAKPYDYLAILLDDKYPFFDKDERKWVGLEVGDDGRYIMPKKEGRSVTENIDEDIEDAKNEGLGNAPAQRRTQVNSEPEPYEF